MITTTHTIRCDSCKHEEPCKTPQAALRRGWFEQERIDIEKFSRQEYIIHLCPECAQDAPEKVITRS